MTSLLLTPDESRALNILCTNDEPMTSDELRKELREVESIFNLSELLKHEYIEIAPRAKGMWIAYQITQRGRDSVNSL